MVNWHYQVQGQISPGKRQNMRKPISRNYAPALRDYFHTNLRPFQTKFKEVMRLFMKKGKLPKNTLIFEIASEKKISGLPHQYSSH